MYSYFEGGIFNCTPTRSIDLPQLIKLIKDNPHKDKIEDIRERRVNDDESYKILKKDLLYITPNCQVKYRSLEDDPRNFDKNFICYSQFMYFDIDLKSKPKDIKTDVEKFKKYFIEKYGDRVSLVCKSSSGGGISVFFKLINIVTKENFLTLMNAIETTILRDETVDPMCKGIGHAMFISSDPDVFFSYENEINVELIDINVSGNEKEVNQCNSYGGVLNTPNYSYLKVLPIHEVYEKLIVETQVPVNNPLVDFKPEIYARVYIPELIKDGTKHNKYTSMIHHLVFLNPDIEKNYIFSFLVYVNNRFAKPKMEFKELFRMFTSVYAGIVKTGEIKYKTKTKRVHFNFESGLGKKEKIKMANKLNGCRKKGNSINKIQEAKLQLQKMGQKVTRKQVAEISGLSLKTVSTHFDAEMIDMDQIIQEINYPNLESTNPSKSPGINIIEHDRCITTRNKFDDHEPLKPRRKTPKGVCTSNTTL